MVDFTIGPQTYTDNLVPGTGRRLGKNCEMIVGSLHGDYFEQASRGNIFFAHATQAASNPIIYSTAAGTNSIVWNGSSLVKASILAVGFGVSVVTTAACAIGLTGGSGQTTAPGSTTAITTRGSTLMGGGTSACTPYLIGTPSAAGTFFFPFGDLHTGALTVDAVGMHWVDLRGMFVIPQYGWIGIASSATATTTVYNSVIVWEEVPVS